MGVWFGNRAAKASSPPAERRSTVTLPSWLFSAGNTSYADVNLSSAESSMQSIAVRSAVDLIASLGSELPVDVYSGVGAERQKRKMPGYLEDPAGDGQGLADWAYQVVESWLLRGNLYGDILQTAPGGHPVQITLHHPDEVSGYLDLNGQVNWTVCGKPVTDLSRFLHRRVNPVPGRVLGLSPVAFHANQIGVTLTSTQFGLQWFRDGAHPGGMLTNEETWLNAEQAKTAKERFMAALRGTREPLVLGKGWKYQQIQINPEESQFLETNKYSEAQCARIFGPGVAEVLGYESGGGLTYTNVESRSGHLLVYSLNKWLRRLERLLSSMLPRPQYVRINRDALLQMTTLDRLKAHEIALRNKIKVVNEVRENEDLAPVEWGAVPDADGPSAERNLAEMVQKIYLGVGKVVTADEAREILNRAGADLAIPGDLPALPAAPGATPPGDGEA